MDLAQREQDRNGGRLADILVQLGFVAPDVLADFLGRQAGARSINLNQMCVDRGVLAAVPLEVARRCVALPVSRQNGTLTVAVADPFNVTTVDTLQQVTGLHIDLVTAPERDILNCLELYPVMIREDFADNTKQQGVVGPVFGVYLPKEDLPLVLIISPRHENSASPTLVQDMRQVIDSLKVTP